MARHADANKAVKTPLYSDQNKANLRRCSWRGSPRKGSQLVPVQYQLVLHYLDIFEAECLESAWCAKKWRTACLVLLAKLSLFGKCLFCCPVPVHR